MCNVHNILPAKGFSINELATSLMTEPPKDVTRSQAGENLKKTLKSLEDAKNNLSHELNGGESINNNVCNQQITHSTSKREINHRNHRSH